jgi:1-acyl-sn-glycerol-3-phosphate acyltransferase
MLILWTLVAIPIQAICLLLPGRSAIVFARVYWATVCHLLGFRVRVIGAAAGRGGEGRPVLFASNHSSWLDIAVLGGQLEAAFIAKGEIARWPVVNVIARLGQTVFVSRQRSATGRERDAMRERLAANGNLILFPEGTSSDGSRVLPFRSSFFSIVDTGPEQGPEQGVERDAHRPLVQPVSVVYDRLGYLPTGRAARPLFAWYGDMNLATHFWRITQHRGLRATVLLHAPLDPASFTNRKAFANAAYRAVADGAATLRQNRPASPIAAPEVTSPGDEAAQPAFV